MGGHSCVSGRLCAGVCVGCLSLPHFPLATHARPRTNPSLVQNPPHTAGTKCRVICTDHQYAPERLYENAASSEETFAMQAGLTVFAARAVDGGGGAPAMGVGYIRVLAIVQRCYAECEVRDHGRGGGFDSGLSGSVRCLPKMVVTWARSIAVFRFHLRHAFWGGFGGSRSMERVIASDHVRNPRATYLYWVTDRSILFLVHRHTRTHPQFPPSRTPPARCTSAQWLL